MSAVTRLCYRTWTASGRDINDGFRCGDGRFVASILAIAWREAPSNNRPLWCIFQYLFQFIPRNVNHETNEIEYASKYD